MRANFRINSFSLKGIKFSIARETSYSLTALWKVLIASLIRYSFRSKSYFAFCLAASARIIFLNLFKRPISENRAGDGAVKGLVSNVS